MLGKDKWNQSDFEEKFDEKDPWNLFVSDYEQTKFKRQINFVKDRVKDPDRILEIGCAEGAHTRLIANEFSDSEIIGIDISDKAINRAKENVNRDKVIFVVEDLVNYIKKTKKCFDVVFWSESIYYVGDKLTLTELSKLFFNLNDLLREGGVLCSANLVDQKRIEENSLTQKEVMRCYLELFRSHFELVNKSKYVEYREVSDDVYGYEIWLFKKQNPS